MLDFFTSKGKKHSSYLFKYICWLALSDKIGKLQEIAEGVPGNTFYFEINWYPAYSTVFFILF
jgi:hypothetical protein